MRFLFVLLLLSPAVHAQKEYVLDTLRLPNNVNLRGLSMVSDKVIWISGTNGFVCVSADGGQTFDTARVKGFETVDFRDVEGFDEKTALIMSAGSPAVILRTTDGGRKWRTVFHDDRKEVFLDGMDFWDEKRGLAYSDPVNRKLVVLTTHNGGNNWKEMPYRDSPMVQDGENGFAASGTSIRTVGEGYAFIGTGGRAAHLFTSSDYGKSWSKKSCPIRKGKTQGIFSVAFKDSRTGIVVGGDFQSETSSTENCFLTFNGGTTWKAPLHGPGGYRSCVEYINQTTLVATGPTGTEYSRDGGNTWIMISPAGFNVVQKAKHGTRVFLAGNDGLLGIITRY